MLDASHVVFPNGAITLVLILAESHLSIHTWPEENLIAIDLFSCGAIDGQAVLDELTAALRLTEVTVRQVRAGPAARSTDPAAGAYQVSLQFICMLSGLRRFHLW